MYTIAIDKETINKISTRAGVEYIYLFDDESLDELLNLKYRSMYYKNCKYVDINLSKYDIECIKSAKVTDKDYDVLPKKKDYKIAIIIPNYNYGYCLEKCFNSIFNQTYQNFEIIFIDDMSTDDSLKIARKYEEEHRDKMKIIPLKQKRYNGGARNEAYLHISDDVDYVYYIDSDDWMYDEYALEKINRHLQSYPDVLFVAIASYQNNRTDVYSIPDYKSKYEAIRGWSGSCGKVIKKNLATSQECLYNEGTLKEDKNQHCKICIHMETFKLLKEPVYVWNRENPNSVTTKRDNILWGTSTIRHYADTLQLYLTYKGKNEEIDNFLEERVQLMEQELQNKGDRQY